MTNQIDLHSSNICPQSPTDPSLSKYKELLRLKPEPRGFNKALNSLFTSEPHLRFQINQISRWENEDGFPSYNLWSPAFFGMTLAQPEIGEYKLNRNDYIVTRSEEDKTLLKESESENLTFDAKDIIGSIDVDRPPFLACTCCLQNRGWVRLSNNERWRFDEISMEYFQFSKVDESSDDKFSHELTQPTRFISWFRYYEWEWRDKEVKPNLPFEMDEDTRLCRISSMFIENNDDISSDHVIAAMNPDGFVFPGDLELGPEAPDTRDLRDLIVLTGLAVAHLERPGLKKYEVLFKIPALC